MASIRRRQALRDPSEHELRPEFPSSPPPPFSLPPPIRNTATNANHGTRHFAPDSYHNSNSNSSNNNSQMERVTFHLHSRVCNFGLDYTTHRFRKIVEHLLLVVAICCGGALVMLHRTFVIPNPMIAGTSGFATTRTCLDRLPGFDPSAADITHLVVLPHNLTLIEPDTAEKDHQGIRTKSRILWNRKPTTTTTTTTTDTNNMYITSAGSDKVHAQSCECPAITMTTREDEDTHSLVYRQWLNQQLGSKKLDIRYSYSTTKAYLMLPQDHPWLVQGLLDVQYVLVAPDDPECFGEPFVQFLLWKSFIGGNTVLLNWLRTFPAYYLHSERQQNPSLGYIYDPRIQWFKEVDGTEGKTSIGDRQRLNDEDHGFLFLTRWNKSFWMKIGVFLRTSFLFFFCTTLVSFTLRETQERMLEFTQELSRRVRESISLSDLITTHLAQNLIFVPIMLGMMFFLIEFYNGDRLLAFGICSIVWCVEGFSLVCLRSSQGLAYFPYFFFLLFLLFHVYQTAFPDHGFVYMALTVVWCFILHSMVFFWHRYELPALVLGDVTIDRPRMNVTLDHSPNSAPNNNNNNNNNRNNDYDRRDPGSNTFHADGASVASASSRRSLSQQHRTEISRHSENDRPITTRRQQNDDLDDGPARSSGSSAIDDSNHWTIPVGRTNTGGAGGQNPFSSRLSLLSTASSRRTFGMYQHNQEDDGSTGSHLYFMGGEVVVHRPTISARTNHQNNAVGNSGSNQTNSSSNRDMSPPSIRRGASFGNEGEYGRSVLIARNESNFSLLSSVSDTHGNGFNANATSIGLEVTGRGSEDQEEEEDHLAGASSSTGTTISEHNDSFGSLPNDTSMDTIPIGNLSTPQKYSLPDDGSSSSGMYHEEGRYHSNNVGAPAGVCSEDYSQESGGLQAILESKLTPKIRNTTHQQHAEREIRHSSTKNKQQHQQLLEQQPQHNSSPSNGMHCRRRPPTFPELTTGG